MGSYTNAFVWCGTLTLNSAAADAATAPSVSFLDGKPNHYHWGGWFLISFVRIDRTERESALQPRFLTQGTSFSVSNSVGYSGTANENKECMGTES